MRADLGIRTPFARQGGDLLLLWSQLGTCGSRSPPHPLAGCLQFSVRTLREAVRAYPVQRCVGMPRLGACVITPVPAAQPFSVAQAGAGEVHRHPSLGDPLDRLLVQALGALILGHYRLAAQRHPPRKIRAGCLGDDP